MYDEHRPYKSCAFCGSQGALTKEHIFGKAIAGSFPLRENWKALYVAPGSPEGMAVKKGGGPILSVAPRMVCATCNNGFLSTEMKSALPALVSMINGTSYVASANEVAALRRYWERIALITDLCTSDWEITDEYRQTEEFARSAHWRNFPPVYELHDRSSWSTGSVPVELTVHIGHHRGVLGLSPNPIITPILTFDRESSSRKAESKKFLVVIGSAVAVVGVRMNLSPWVSSAFIRISEWGTESLKWPPAQAVSYEDYLCPPTQDNSLQIQRSMMLYRPTRRRVERLARKLGSFDDALTTELQRSQVP